MTRHDVRPLEFPWVKNNYNEWMLSAPCRLWDGRTGFYEIHITPRPRYCDRGDWLIHMDGKNDSDAEDRFPRYFFGTLEEAKRQMETFLLRREAYREARP